MIIVADTGPLHYLVLIGAADVLHPYTAACSCPRQSPAS
jgi:hypothetical protein